MRRILGVLLLVSVLSSTGYSQGLLNLVQWPSDEGGNDHWYAVMSEQYYWADALVAAPTIEVDGYFGHLATITSAAENEFIFSNLILNSLEPLYGDQAWLGARDVGDNTWEWITGEEMVYTNWAPGEPNNLGTELTMSMWDVDTDPNKPNQVPGMWNNSLSDQRDWWSIVEWDAQAVPSPPVDTEPTPIPEPTTLVLFGFGLIGLPVVKKIF